MKFKIDENLPIEAALMLENNGHSAETVYSEGIQGCPDPALAVHCRQEKRILITLDVGFSNIVNYPPGTTEGIIVIRIGVLNKGSIIEAIEQLIPNLNMFVIGDLWIVEKERIRIRKQL